MSTIIEKIKTIEDACADRGTTLEEVTPYPQPKNARQIAVNCFEQALVVIEALNGGRLPNYDDKNQRKWEIWWDMRSEAAGGPGFSLRGVDCYHSSSCVGARLVFLDYETARYFATQFKHLMEGFMATQTVEAVQ